MIRFRETRLAGYVAALMLFSMYIAPAVSSAASSRAMVVKTVIVMPFQTPTTSPIETLGTDMAQSITSGLGASGAIKAVQLSERLPSIRRAKDYDKSIKKEDLAGPFGTEKDQIQTALKIARETGADYMLVGSVDDIKADVDAKKAEMAVSACLVDVKTGETVKTEVLTGQSLEGSKATTEVDLVAQAAGDAVAKVVANMAVPTQTAVLMSGNGKPAVHRSSKSGKGKWIVGLLVAVAVGVAVSNHGSSSSSGTGIDNPPPPPGG